MWPFKKKIDVAADGLGGRGGFAPGGMEPARPAPYVIDMVDGLALAEELWGAGPGIIKLIPSPTVIAKFTAYIDHDFEQKPWSELGRQWPHPESYLDKLRLFRSRENLGDRQVIVTVCLADNWPTPEGVSP